MLKKAIFLCCLYSKIRYLYKKPVGDFTHLPAPSNVNLRVIYLAEGSSTRFVVFIADIGVILVLIIKSLKSLSPPEI